MPGGADKPGGTDKPGGAGRPGGASNELVGLEGGRRKVADLDESVDCDLLGVEEDGSCETEPVSDALAGDGEGDSDT